MSPWQKNLGAVENNKTDQEETNQAERTKAGTGFALWTLLQNALTFSDLKPVFLNLFFFCLAHRSEKTVKQECLYGLNMLLFLELAQPVENSSKVQKQDLVDATETGSTVKRRALKPGKMERNKEERAKNLSLGSMGEALFGGAAKVSTFCSITVGWVGTREQDECVGCGVDRGCLSVFGLCTFVCLSRLKGRGENRKITST